MQQFENPADSGESEYNAYVGGLADFIYVHSALTFVLDEEIERHTFLDSSSARGLLNRRRVSKIRHVSGKLLWCQNLAKDQWTKAHPLDTLRNPADNGTKSLAGDRVACCTCWM